MGKGQTDPGENPKKPNPTHRKRMYDPKYWKQTDASKKRIQQAQVKKAHKLLLANLSDLSQN